MNEKDRLMDELSRLQKKIADLERNKQLYKETEVSGKIGGWQFDPITLKQTWSEEIFRILEIDLEHGAPEVPKGLEFIDHEFREMAEKAVKRAMEYGEPYKQEWMVTTHKGNIKWVKAVGNPKMENGKVVSVSGSFQDITSEIKAKQELIKSKERLRTVIDNSPFPLAVVDENDNHIQHWSKSAIQLFGYSPKTTEEWYELAYPNTEYRHEVIERWKPFLEMAQNSKKAVNTGEYEICCKDGSLKICELYAQFIPGSLIITLNDITERKKTEDQLKKIEWLLLPKKEKSKVMVPDYGDLTTINNNRTILDSVGKEVLNEIVTDYLSLLETSAAVYEKNGDYAVGIFSSEWCQFLDCSSRELCISNDNKKAIKSGKWLCHESCWADASGKSILANEAVDIECSGGLHIYAIPIRANGEVIGSINFGYGNPPTDEDKLSEIALKYNVPVDKLKKLAQTYETRPAFIIDIAKEKLATSAKLIGNIVERNQMEENLLKNQRRYEKAQEIGHVGNWEYDPVTTNFWASDEAKRIYGYDLNIEDFSTDMVENCIPERERVHQALVDLLEHNKKYDLVFDILTYEKGVRKTIRSVAEVERDYNGNPLKVIGVISDISTQKKANDKLVALNQQLQANEQQLNAANQQLQASEQQLKAANQQLMAANQQLQANEQQLRSSNESLQASERKFRNLFNAMQEGVYLHRLVYNDRGKACDYKIIEANPISEKYLNIKREDAIGRLATELFQTKEAPFLDIYSKVAETGEPISFEQYFEPMDKYFLVTAFSPKKGDFATVFLDITKRKLTEISLSLANKELKKVQEISHVGSFSIDFDTNEVRWTEELYKIYGFDPGLPPPLLNDSQTLFTPESWELLSNSIAKTAETGIPYEIELNTALKDGKIGWMWARGEAKLNNEGRITGIWGVVQDISERKLAEKEFRESEERFRELVNTINSGVAIYDVINEGKTGGDYIIKEFNRFALNHEQLDINEVIGKSLKDIRPNIDDYGLIEMFQKVWKTGKPAFFPAKVYVDEKYSNYYENRIFRLPNGEVVAIYDDVTEREIASDQIKESQERFDLAMNASNDGLFDWNLETNSIYYSPGWKKMLGYEDDELPNDFSVWEKTTAPDDVKKSWEMQQKVISKQLDRFEMEFKMKHKDGHWVDILSRASAIFNDKGKAIRMIGTHVDVTERKQAEVELKKISERLQFATEGANIGTWHWNTITGELIWSSVMNELFDVPIEEMITYERFSQALHPDDRLRTDEAVKNALENHTDFSMEYRSVWRDGSVHWLKALGRGFYDEQGKNIRMEGVVIDINDQKKAEKELLLAKEKAEESEERIRQIFENSTIVHYSHDLDNYVNYVSPEVENILGYTPEEIIVKWTSLVSDNPINDIAYRNTAKAIETGEKQESYQLEFIHKNGKRVLVEAHEAPVVKDGKTISIVGSFADITERKKTELKLAEAKEKAEESDRLKSAFLANMSHEIRTPMNGILGFSRLLKEPKLAGHEQQKYIDIIEKSGARMLNIINDIIDVSKIEAGLMTVEITETSINEQIEYIYTFFKPEADAKGLKLTYKNTLPSKEAIIETDREKVFAIFTNLVKNAIKYSNDGSIEVGYNKKDDFIVFYVADTGIGIPNNRQEAIFERFIQSDIEDTMAHQGAGLGLAITKAYVEMLGGRIWVESEEGRGSAFYFTLPYNKKEEPEVTFSDTQISDNEPIKNIKVLIAEDDETSGQLFEIILGRYVDEIIKVTSGKDAIEALKNNQDIDLILMDIQMPGLNGYDATKAIRKFNKDIIIIAQTAYGLSGDREKSIKAGCTDYITKPIDKDELLALIRKYFGVSK